MRRSLTAAAVVGLTLGAALVALPSASYAAAPGGSDRPDRTSRATVVAAAALERATAALTGRASPADTTRPEATLALRDLFVALPRLATTERRRAESLLARPTDRRSDAFGDGYRAPSTRSCAAHVCVHRVRRTTDRATGTWALRTLHTMKRVWRREVGGLGYRRPLRDGRRGGDRRLDVYLADVGEEGLYGYCAPELARADNARLASGYCVLDNDFARSQFGARPADSLRATAGHEFFHTVQFAYDYREDPWLMETTATWMEERVADAVDDNRRYLPHGQVAVPWQPLDLFDRTGATQYGNWAFFEYLSGRFGTRLVRTTWEQAGHRPADGRTWSTRAVEAALPAGERFAEVYAAFAAANVRPELTYPEGEHWPSARPTRAYRLGEGQGFRARPRIHHLAGHVFSAVPRAALTGRTWRLRVTVDGPDRVTSPAVTVVRLTPAGELRRTRVGLDAAGDGHVAVPFNRAQTRALWIVATNASTRFDCRGRYVARYSCGGTPRDDGQLFAVGAHTFTTG